MIMLFSTLIMIFQVHLCKGPCLPGLVTLKRTQSWFRNQYFIFGLFFHFKVHISPNLFLTKKNKNKVDKGISCSPDPTTNFEFENPEISLILKLVLKAKKSWKSGFVVPELVAWSDVQARFSLVLKILNYHNNIKMTIFKINWFLGTDELRTEIIDLPGEVTVIASRTKYSMSILLSSISNTSNSEEFRFKIKVAENLGLDRYLSTVRAPLYSQVPNKQAGPNKRVGWLFWANFINEKAQINE